MLLSIKTHLLYSVSQPTDVLLQIEPFTSDEQRVDALDLQIDGTLEQVITVGEDGIGQRRWIRAETEFECHLEAKVTVMRSALAIDSLPATPRSGIPGEVIKYLMPSRYCYPEQFLEFTSSQFGALSGGALVDAMCQWVKTNFTYDSDASALGATASDSFQRLSGVCRDYAHVLITLVRAAGIPARFVSVYAPDVEPQDFHAVVEVYLDGRWHLLDPTGMASAQDMACICVGRDAADTPFMTSYGWMNLQEQTVEARRA